MLFRSAVALTPSAAAISVNYVEMTNTAKIGASTIVSVGLEVQALKTNIAGDTVHTFAAVAKSGSGASDGTSVAGALAINIVNGARTEAVVVEGASLTIGGGDFAVSAESEEKDTAQATSTADRKSVV